MIYGHQKFIFGSVNICHEPKMPKSTLWISMNLNFEIRAFVYLCDKVNFISFLYFLCIKMVTFSLAFLMFNKIWYLIKTKPVCIGKLCSIKNGFTLFKIKNQQIFEQNLSLNFFSIATGFDQHLLFNKRFKSENEHNNDTASHWKFSRYLKQKFTF